eukprot:Platyproteum_vivax@DN6689_c0_g1_i2.p1
MLKKDRARCMESENVMKIEKKDMCNIKQEMTQKRRDECKMSNQQQEDLKNHYRIYLNLMCGKFILYYRQLEEQIGLFIKVYYSPLKLIPIYPKPFLVLFLEQQLEDVLASRGIVPFTKRREQQEKDEAKRKEEERKDITAANMKTWKTVASVAGMLPKKDLSVGKTSSQLQESAIASAITNPKLMESKSDKKAAEECNPLDYLVFLDPGYGAEVSKKDKSGEIIEQAGGTQSEIAVEEVYEDEDFLDQIDLPIKDWENKHEELAFEGYDTLTQRKLAKKIRERPYNRDGGAHRRKP